jgi:F0F1-type ATP synthase membrane subunit b/b'
MRGKQTVNFTEDRLIAALDRRSHHINEARASASALRQVADMLESKSPKGAEERHRIAQVFEKFNRSIEISG